MGSQNRVGAGDGYVLATSMPVKESVNYSSEPPQHKEACWSAALLCTGCTPKGRDEKKRYGELRRGPKALLVTKADTFSPKLTIYCTPGRKFRDTRYPETEKYDMTLAID